MAGTRTEKRSFHKTTDKAWLREKDLLQTLESLNFTTPRDGSSLIESVAVILQKHCRNGKSKIFPKIFRLENKHLQTTFCRRNVADDLLPTTQSVDDKGRSSNIYTFHSQTEIYIFLETRS